MQYFRSIKLNLKKIAALCVVFVILLGLFALDLANQGLAWRMMYSLTGEESAIAQVRGMVELGGNLTRAPLQLATDAPIRHVEMQPYGINTFLEQEVLLEAREQSVRMISDAGFTWIRQQFSWEDIEVHARGDFMDRRNMDVLGEISAWDKYDNIVDLADQYGLQIMARLDNPPSWSHADQAIGAFAPPDDIQDFVNYASAVATRYQGRIRYYQVWNEPNIYPEWGNQPVNPEAYTDMLCRTYAALKAVDPEIVVISGALAPTLELSGRDLNDVIFLQRMYDAGAADCFDVLSAQAYGFFSSATDQRMRPTTVTFSHNLYLRDVMVANGDANTPIWLSEAAWNPVDSPDVPQTVANREAYGSVTPEQAARYMPEAYQRADEEWNWVGVMFYWYFKRAGTSEAEQSWYYFRAVEPDFTPMPVYHSLTEYIHNRQANPTLYSGIHAPNYWAIQSTGDPTLTPADDSTYGQTLSLTQADALTFTAHGTDLTIRWRGSSPLTIQAGDQTHTVEPSAAWIDSTIPLSTFVEGHAIQIRGAQAELDSLTIGNRWQHLTTPLLFAGAAVFISLITATALIIKRRKQAKN